MKEFQLDIIRFIQRSHSGILNQLVEGITYIGEITLIIALITFIYYIYDKKLGKKVVYISVFSMLTNNVLKLLIKAPRPIGEPGIVSIRIETAGGYSFPSGHSQNTATLFTWLAKIIKQRKFTIIGIVVVVLVMFSRLYLGVHYPVDVVVGSLLGWGISCFLFTHIDRVRKPHLLAAIMALIFLPFLILFGLQDPLMAHELFKMYGLFVGSIVAFVFEEKYVQFTMNTCRWRASLRFVLGIALALGLQAGLKFVLPASHVGDLIRYFAIAFVALGLYPYLFKKLRF